MADPRKLQKLRALEKLSDLAPGARPAASTGRRLERLGELTAVAHPLRMAILELLTLEGPLTATELADRLDETPANCSWHLRKLAEHALIEEAEGGTGRQRPWQVATVGMTWGEDDPGPEERRAGQALTAALLRRWVDRFLAADQRLAESEPDWHRASWMRQSMTWLTAEELAEANERIAEVVDAHRDRMSDPSLRPEGSRLVEMVAWAAPVEVTA